MQKKYFLSLFIFWLGGCTTLSTKPATTESATITPSHWSARGRAAIKTPEQQASVSFFWQQRGQTYQLHLFGPLGIGAVQLIGNSQQVVLTNYQGKQIMAASAQDLLQQTLGWSIPVEHLRYWLWAMPAPQLAAELTPKPPAPLQALIQEGWQIHYAHYQGIPALPHLLICTRPNLEIRIAIDRWSP